VVSLLAFIFQRPVTFMILAGETRSFVSLSEFRKLFWRRIPQFMPLQIASLSMGK
jgi:hypothetical protein